MGHPIWGKTRGKAKGKPLDSWESEGKMMWKRPLKSRECENSMDVFLEMGMSSELPSFFNMTGWKIKIHMFYVKKPLHSWSMVHTMFHCCYVSWSWSVTYLNKFEKKWLWLSAGLVTESTQHPDLVHLNAESARLYLIKSMYDIFTYVYHKH